MAVSSGKGAFLLLLIVTLFLTSACGSVVAGVGFKPLFSPVTFFINTDGSISAQGDLSIETPVGEVVIETSASSTLLPEDNTLLSKADNNSLLIIVRHKQRGSVVDDGYKIQTGQDEVVVVTNGTTTIDVTSHNIFIDASHGDVKSITVKDANSTPASTPLVAQTPDPTPVSRPSMSVTTAANLITQYYDEKGEFAGTYLMKRITSMTLSQTQNAQKQACAAYESAQLTYPESTYQTDSRTFTLQYSGTRWAVVSMGGYQSCVVSSGTRPPPQPSSAAPPPVNQAAPLIETFYDHDWNGMYVLQSIQSITYRQQVGNFIGACVQYTYYAPDHPNDPPLHFHAEFGFQYENGAWKVDAWDQYGCGPTNYN